MSVVPDKAHALSKVLHNVALFELSLIYHQGLLVILLAKIGEIFAVFSNIWLKIRVIIVRIQNIRNLRAVTHQSDPVEIL
jgi:hypothetical protein